VTEENGKSQSRESPSQTFNLVSLKYESEALPLQTSPVSGVFTT